MYRTLMRTSLSITFSSYITLLLYYSTVFSAFRYTLFIHKCIAFQYYSLSFSFPFLPPHSPLRQAHYYNPISLFLSLSLYIYIYIYIYICIKYCVYIYIYIYFAGLSSTYEGKYFTFVLLSLAYLISHGDLHFHPSI
jgi:hypothetical protein